MTQLHKTINTTNMLLSELYVLNQTTNSNSLNKKSPANAKGNVQQQCTVIR